MSSEPEGREPWDHRDSGPRGLQRERTLLAWNRTLLALVVTTVLLVRVAGAPYVRALHLPALAAMLVAGGLWVRTDLRYRRGPEPGRLVAPGALLLMAVTATLVGVTAIAVLGLQ